MAKALTCPTCSSTRMVASGEASFSQPCRATVEGDGLKLILHSRPRVNEGTCEPLEIECRDCGSPVRFWNVQEKKWRMASRG